MAISRALLALLAASALVLASCASSATSGSPVPTDHVNLPKSYRFDPTAITVKAGTTVTWTNSDNFSHTVQLLDPSPDAARPMGPGESVTITFAMPGTFRYQCSLHPQNMQGTVVVTA